jgi:dTDP-4-dehydrorhamnose 3,5-epimerase
MKVEGTSLPGVLILEPQLFSDRRGVLFESYRADACAGAGVTTPFVQDTQARSAPGTIRGLHYQLLQPQAKLVRVLRGAIWDVVVDVRRGSPTFGQWTAIEISADNLRQVYVPAGFAHGYSVGGVEAEVLYKTSDYYVAGDQYGIIWNDPGLAIPWPVTKPILSERDRSLGPLDPARADLPLYWVDAARGSDGARRDTGRP